MSEFAKAYIIPTLVGITVAALTYLLMGDWERQGSVSYDYRYVEYPSDLPLSDKEVMEALFEFLEKEQNKQGELAESVKKVLSDFLTNFQEFHILGSYGYIEQIEIESQESRKSVSVRIEGRDIDYSHLDYRGKDDETYTENFDKVVNLLPGENLTIINLQRRELRYIYLDDESDNIFISIDGNYIKPDNRERIFDEIFGKTLLDYPFAFLILSLVGAMTMVLLAVEIGTRIVPSWRRWSILQSSDKDFAIIRNALEHLRKNDPDRFAKIEKFAVKDRVFQLEDENDQA
ncbi:MAG: hypothetical protein QNJ44_23450 [Rhodobacter sp.]|nr:hypothetical protein [Rhodobacter sp.]